MQPPNPTQKPVAAFFKENFATCLSIYDNRRGLKEGQEYEKVLCFYPTRAALTIRTAIIGLAQAVASFASSFAKEESHVKFMEAECNQWAMLQVEPDIWFLMVINKAWSGPACCNATLHGFLQSVYSMFVLLHGPIQKMLEQDATALMARRYLQPFMDEVGGRLLQHETKEHAQLTNPLAQHYGLPLLATPHSIFLNVQCMINRLLVASVGGSRIIHGVFASWHGHPLWSTLEAHDSITMHHFTQRALLPAAGISNRKNQLGQTGAMEAAVETLLSSLQWAAVGPDGDIPITTPSLPVLPLYATAPPKPPAQGFLVPKLRQTSRQLSLGGGAMLPVAGQPQPAMQAARVWIKGSQEHCLLLPCFDGPLLMVLLLHDATVISREVLSSLTEVLAQNCPAVAAQLARDVSSKHVWHEPGYRYSFLDDACLVSRVSPLKKVATLSAASSRLVAHVRNKLDYWSAAQLSALHDNPSLTEGNSELLCRSASDAWVGARCVGHWQLTVAMEQPPEPNLAGVSSHVDRLCNKLCPAGMLL